MKTRLLRRSNFPNSVDYFKTMEVRTIAVAILLGALGLFALTPLMPLPLRDVGSSSSKRNGPSTVSGPSQHDSESRQPHYKIHKDSHASGGIVFFMHVPKTGGDAMQRNMMNHSNVEYSFGIGNDRFNRLKRRMEQVVMTGTDNDSIFWAEAHTAVPSFLSIVKSDLMRWRATAQQNGVTWAISSFEYNCVAIKRCGRPPETEDSLLQISVANPQCSYLSKGWHELQRKASWDPSPEDCNQVYDTLLDQMDWVGTMEAYNETLHVPEEIMGRDVLSTWKKYNVGHGKLNPSTVSNNTLEYLERISWLDRELYNKVSWTYALSERLEGVL